MNFRRREIIWGDLTTLTNNDVYMLCLELIIFPDNHLFMKPSTPTDTVVYCYIENTANHCSDHLKLQSEVGK